MKRKWSSFGRFERYTDDGLVAVFKDRDGWRYRFLPSVHTQNGTGYATSIHFWKTLKAAKNYLSRNLHYMQVADPDKRIDYFEYTINDGKIFLVDK
jgi:hypothetical protein